MTAAHSACTLGVACLLLLSLLLSASAAVLPFTSPASTPWIRAGFGQESRANSSQSLSFTWLLPQRNLDLLHSTFQAVSDPRSASYRNFLTTQSIRDVIAPDSSTVRPVLDFLASQGVQGDAVVDRGDSLRVTASVAQVEALFNTEVHLFHHQLDGNSSNSGSRTVLRAANGLTLPDDVAAVTRDILSLRDLPLTRSRHILSIRPRGSSPASAVHRFEPQSYTKPNCEFSSGTFLMTSIAFVQSRYNMTNRASTTGSDNVSIAVFGGVKEDDSPSGSQVHEVYGTSDITAFQQANDIDQSPRYSTAAYAAVNNQLYQGQGNVPAEEATLDMSSIYGYSPTSTVSLYAETGSETDYDAYNSFLELPASERPSILSISYGYDSDTAAYLGASARSSVDTVFMELGLAGVTVVVSSGDNGAQGANAECSTSLSSSYGVPDGTSLLPQWPADSPYVLSVGATDFLYNIGSSNDNSYFSTTVSVPQVCGSCPAGTGGYACQTGAVAEQAVSSVANVSGNAFSGFSSGGGFSTYAATPSWQSAAVSAYLNTECSNGNHCILPPSSYYNADNRAYPDVSAFGGTTFFIVYDGATTTVGGTSVAAPSFAAVVARLNEVSLRLTGGSLGFINPLLYSMWADTASLPAGQRAFNDIVHGDNVCPQISTASHPQVTAANCYLKCSGYYTAPGYDPVTGLGTPNVGVMVDWLTAQLSSTSSSSDAASSSTAAFSSSSASNLPSSTASSFAFSSSPAYFSSSSPASLSSSSSSGLSSQPSPSSLFSSSFSALAVSSSTASRSSSSAADTIAASATSASFSSGTPLSESQSSTASSAGLTAASMPSAISLLLAVAVASVVLLA